MTTMNSFRFTKMHGLGNNYIYVNQFTEQLPEEKLADIAIAVSNVHTGIGSDGMILICPSDVAPVKMRIFNNDGSEGKNCGNGLRCVAKYAYENGLVNETEFAIETLSGVVQATVHVQDRLVREATINMGQPRLLREQIPMVGNRGETVIAETQQFADAAYEVTAVSMGNPHLVFYVDYIEDAPLYTLGPIVEKDERFPESVNVEFVEVVNEQELHFRVWERGSGVTQACGTGACAAVVASVLNGKTVKNKETIVHLAGGDLRITWDDDDIVWMTGPCTTVCHGEYFLVER